MAKLRFRFRLSRFIPSFLYKDSTTTTTTTTTTSSSNPNYQTNSFDFSPSNSNNLQSVPVVSSSHNCCPRRRLQRRFHRRRLTFSSGADPDADTDDLRETHKWHVVSCARTEYSPSSSPPRRKIDSHLLSARNRRRNRRESVSSGDDSGWFSSDEEYEYDSNYNKPHEESCFAVRKTSEDPRADFRRSMAEMVVERGIYDVPGLEKLLECFLSLNEPRHRAAIVEAFEDVWYGIFPQVALAATFPNLFYKC